MADTRDYTQDTIKRTTRTGLRVHLEYKSRPHTRGSTSATPLPSAAKPADIRKRVVPSGPSDHAALVFARTLANLACMFRGRRRHRAECLSALAGTPAMTAAMFEHFGFLRRVRDDEDRVGSLLDIAESQRRQFIVWSEAREPGWLRRVGIAAGQILGFVLFGILRALAPRTAMRTLGYFHALQVRAQTSLLDELKRARRDDGLASPTAMRMLDLPHEAHLSDAVRIMRAQSCAHRDAAHALVDILDTRDGHAPNPPV